MGMEENWSVTYFTQLIEVRAVIAGCQTPNIIIVMHSTVIRNHHTALHNIIEAYSARKAAASGPALVLLVNREFVAIVKFELVNNNSSRYLEDEDRCFLHP